jgi:hypothetical protein
MLPHSWKPVPHSVVRLGSPNDGGYLVSPLAVEQADVLLSMGLSDDWAFEEQFRELNPVPVVCLDHTVTPRFWIKRALASGLRGVARFLAYRRFFRGTVEHRRVCVGYDGAGSVSLPSLLAEMPNDAIFLKCDIEGAEYRLLSDIAAHAHRFTGIAIELHDIDLHRDRISRFLASMPDFRVVALHPNNCAGTDGAGDPLVVELTLTRHDLAGPRTLAAEHGQPNDPERPDIELRFVLAEARAA